MSEPLDAETLAGEVTESDDPITPTVEKDRTWKHFPRAERKNRTKKPRKPPPPKQREGTYVKPLMEMYGTIGMGVSLFDGQCGLAVMQNAESCAVAMDKLARENPAVRRVVVQMITSSVWSQIMVAHAPIVYAIGLHHVPALAKSPAGQMQTAAYKAHIEKAQRAEAEERAYYEAMIKEDDAA